MFLIKKRQDIYMGGSLNHSIYATSGNRTHQLEDSFNLALGDIRPSRNVEKAPLTGRIHKFFGTLRGAINNWDDGYYTF